MATTYEASQYLCYLLTNLGYCQANNAKWNQARQKLERDQTYNTLIEYKIRISSPKAQKFWLQERQRLQNRG